MSFTEYRLVAGSAGSGVAYHVVKMPTALTQAQPVTMHRRIPELAHLETPQQQQQQLPNPADPSAVAPTKKPAMSQEDIAKIAPESRSSLHNAYAKAHATGTRPMTGKFQKKSRQMFFGLPEDGEDPLARAKKKDPDRYPWVMRDSSDNVLLGSVQVDSAASDRVLLVVMPHEEAASKQMKHAFIVTPVTKIHKMSAKPKFQAFTTEEAEDKMKQKRGIERWGSASGNLLKRKKTDDEIAEEVDGIKLTPEDRAKIAKAMKTLNPALAKSIQNRSTNGAIAADGIDEDIDYDHEMSDDENPDFGIENEEDAREAKKREYGNEVRRLNMDELDEENKEREWRRELMNQKTSSKAQKKIKKALRKYNDDVIVSDEETNAFGEISEDEDSEIEPEKLPANQPSSKPTSPALTNGTKNAAGSPTLKAPTPDPAKVAKQKKKELDISGYDAVSAARKAMYGRIVDTNKLRTLNGFSVQGDAVAAVISKIHVKGGGTSPTLDQGASNSPDLNLSSPSSSPAGPKIRLKVGGGNPSDGSSSNSNNQNPVKPKSEPPPPPKAADVLAQQKFGKKATESPSLDTSSPIPKRQKSSANSSPNVGAGTSSMFSSSSNSPNFTMPATSPRLDELRGKKKRPLPSPNAGSSPGLTPTINNLTTNSPAIPPTADAMASPKISCINHNADILTEEEFRSLFLRPNPPRSVKDVIALVKDKMKFAGNKNKLSELFKKCCKISGVDADGTKFWLIEKLLVGIDSQNFGSCNFGHV
ncbi:hypothetical protein HK100_002335 [Physocladia obscura]|uniref:Transcription initiation factor IIF subunit alpha n=1 Tax=Physocladia obscura TaxID=109957 RepID=A0AAD5XB60_9FUNG|nr:hypothetical protein HK100_002335 [Physocladia obscura]